MSDTLQQVTHVRLLLEAELPLPALKVTPTASPEEAVAEAFRRTSYFYGFDDLRATAILSDHHGPDTAWRVIVAAVCFCQHHPDFTSLSG